MNVNKEEDVLVVHGGIFYIFIITSCSIYVFFFIRMKMEGTVLAECLNSILFCVC